MGLPEFTEEFEIFKGTLPDPKMVAWHVNGGWLPDPDYALDQTEMMFYRWWASMVSARDQFRLLLQRQEGEALCFGVAVGIPYVLARIDWVIDFLERLPPIPDWNTPGLTIAQRVELRDFAVRYLPSVQRWLSRTRSLRSSFQSMRDTGHDTHGAACAGQLV